MEAVLPNKCQPKQVSDTEGDTEGKPPRPTVTEILQRYYPEYEERAGDTLSQQKADVMALLLDCQTNALGGHWWECQDCGNKHRSYNSCRNRHCSRCTARTREQWLERVMSWVLPVNYFHCVFTTPHELNPLICANERVFYQLQFLATRKALTQRGADPEEPLGGVQLGFQMMLHTWGQLMLPHLHSHVVVLGGGVRLDGSGWVSSGEEFFLDEQRLADTYRDLFVKELRQLYREKKLALAGKLSYLQDESAFAEFCDALAKRCWVIHTGSPEHCKHPAAALKYLSRYVVGAAISDHRIVKDEDGQVTIRYKDYRQGKKRTTKTMSGVEFVRRYAMHILPARFPRVRYGGFLNGSMRKATLAAIRAKIGVVEEPSEDEDSDLILEAGEDDWVPETDYPCVKCGARSMKWIGLIPATRGWQVYGELVARTLPRRVQERLQAEAEAAIAAYRQQCGARRARPP